ncbi:GDP-6-deoxy-D-mannose reductase [Alphaproteobacteria bacterium SO-S41]|nr:GDP-6-deoxy-D-mannose reductase [Alphaproteobacteria bacterium SO-S41]
MPSRILLTGGGGFIGGHVLDLLQSKKADASIHWVTSGAAPSPEGRPAPIIADLSEPADCQRIVEDVAPNIVIHLAGAASVGGTKGVEASVWRNNFTATKHLASAVAQAGLKTTFVFASSAEVYGHAFNGVDRASEQTIPDPQSTYGRTKLAAEFILRDMLASEHQVFLLRLFNSFGPKQDERFVVGSLASQVARIERGDIPPVLLIGNREAKRDFLDVRDTAEAIFRVATKDAPFAPGVTVFNVATGIPRPIDAIVDQLKKLSPVHFEVQVDPERLRPSDVPSAAGDAQALQSYVQWRPTIEWDQSMRDTLDWWRTKPAQEA